MQQNRGGQLFRCLDWLTRSPCLALQLFFVAALGTAACARDVGDSQSPNGVPVQAAGGENAANPNRPISLTPFAVSSGYPQKTLAVLDAFPSVLNTNTALRSWTDAAADWAKIGLSTDAQPSLGLPAVSMDANFFYYPVRIGAAVSASNNCGATCTLGALVAASLLKQTPAWVTRVAPLVQMFSNGSDSHAFITANNTAYDTSNASNSMPLVYAGILWSEVVASNSSFAAGIGAPSLLAHSRALVPVVTNMAADAWQHRTFDAQSQKVSTNTIARWDMPAALSYSIYQGYLLSGEASLLAASKKAMDSYASNANLVLDVEMGALAPLMAARLNAEQNQSYDVNRLLNAVIAPQKNMLAGMYGQVDFSGLMGVPTLWGGWAMAQHSFQTAAWIAPIARYAPAYARAIGKWLTSLSYNATRFYPDALAVSDQVDYDWYTQTKLALPYEGTSASKTETAVASSTPMGGRGTAVQAGGTRGPGLQGAWGAAYLARMVLPTDVAGVMAFDLLVTDFQHAPAYPTYLYYNATATQQTIHIDAGSAATDIVDTVTGASLVLGAMGKTAVTIGADAALVLVLVPNNLTQTTVGKQTQIDGITVDWGTAL